VNLAASHIHGVYAGCASFQKAVGKASGGTPCVKHDFPGGGYAPGVQSRLQLAAATGDKAFRGETDRGVVREKPPGVSRAFTGNIHLAAQNRGEMLLARFFRVPKAQNIQEAAAADFHTPRAFAQTFFSLISA
jgi:hypothetical protein